MCVPVLLVGLRKLSETILIISKNIVRKAILISTKKPVRKKPEKAEHETHYIMDPSRINPIGVVKYWTAKEFRVPVRESFGNKSQFRWISTRQKNNIILFSKREQCLLISPLTHSIRDWGSVNVRISFVHFLSTKLPDVLINSWWTCWPVPLIVIYCIDFKGDEVILYRLSLIRRATN